ncbi:universal stress protein [Solicola sp. PLA-1-18]|uniref:universal stress protein n=1 Tax=Solicola sp. PLA-1-18 TaxID=3380532 RepID=UPI003B794731
MTVVAAYAPTPLGADAVHEAAAEARRRAEPLLVLNTASGAAVADPALATDDQLERLRRDLEGTGVDVEVRQVRHASSAAEAVLDVVRAEEASLLVIGLRHRSVVGKFLLGSTAQTLLLDAPCHVLAVKPSATHDRGAT